MLQAHSPRMSISAKIAEIELEVARTQKNKATNFHLGQLKAKLAKLKKELIEGTSGGSGGGGGGAGDIMRTFPAKKGQADY